VGDLMVRILTLLCCLLPFLVHAEAVPKIEVLKAKEVELTEFTKLTIDIVPDLGTRFVFPFVLDEETNAKTVPFTSNMTSNVFISDRKDGRNTFVVTVALPEGADPSAQYLGNFFVTVAGYNIAVRLRTTNDLRKHVDDINFKLSGAARTRLIDDEIEKRLATLRLEYRRKRDALDAEADLRALSKIGYLALSEPDQTSVHEESSVVLESGEKMILSVSIIKVFGKFTVIPFEFTSKLSEAARVLDVKLFGQTDGLPEQLIDVGLMVVRRVDSGESINGTLATLHPSILDFDSLRVVLSTDKGEVVVQW
jgi:hypothetical protein